MDTETVKMYAMKNISDKQQVSVSMLHHAMSPISSSKSAECGGFDCVVAFESLCLSDLSSFSCKLHVTQDTGITSLFQRTKVLFTHFCQNCHSSFKLANLKIHSFARTFKDDSNSVKIDTQLLDRVAKIKK